MLILFEFEMEKNMQESRAMEGRLEGQVLNVKKGHLQQDFFYALTKGHFGFRGKRAGAQAPSAPPSARVAGKFPATCEAGMLQLWAAPPQPCSKKVYSL